MFLEGNAFLTSDMSDLNILNLKKQTNIITNASSFHFILLFSMFIFFKAQLTASHVSSEFWKLNLPVKTYHGGEHTYILFFVVVGIIIIIIVIIVITLKQVLR